ncbi:MAG: hypothetical protein RSA08_04055 [Clostridia bacterium]
MGNTYTVPRSAKGESRILYIFTIKSFISTAVIGLIGAGIWFVGSNYFGMSIFVGLAITVFFGIIGFLLGTAKIPDIQAMGKFRSASGETLTEIIFRFFAFKSKKRLYLYNYKRQIEKEEDK